MNNYYQKIIKEKKLLKRYGNLLEPFEKLLKDNNINYRLEAYNLPENLTKLKIIGLEFSKVNFYGRRIFII